MRVLRVVFDTSVLLTQARSGLTASSLWMAIRGLQVEPSVSWETYRHLRDKLAEPKFGIPTDHQATILAEYLRLADYVGNVPDAIQGMVEHPREKHFFDLAFAREVHALVSLSSVHLAYRGQTPFRICNITEFLGMLRPEAG